MRECEFAGRPPFTERQCFVDVRNMKERQTKESDERQAVLRKRIADAQRILRKHVPANVSLADELIAERREEARREAEED